MIRSSAAAREDPCLIEVKRRELEQQLVAHRKYRGGIGELLRQVRKDHFAIRQLDPLEHRAPRLEHFPACLNRGIRHGYRALNRFLGPGASQSIGKFSTDSPHCGKDLA
jgi:hypothetical protein